MCTFRIKKNVFFITNCLVLCFLIMFIVFLFTILLKETRIKNVQKTLIDVAKINQEYNSRNSVYQKDANMVNLYQLNQLMGQYNIKSLNSMVFTDLEIRTQKPTHIEKIALISCFIVGILVTAFTFVWGII